VVWRAIGDAGTAMTALLEGELDVLDRVGIEDYFGARTQGEDFAKRFYKAFNFTPELSVRYWNTARPELADPRVRTALALCFDWDGYIANFYRGAAVRVTGEQVPFGPAYDRDVAPTPFDPARARRLLAEAGWIDRDGDGRVDREGEPLTIGFLFGAGNDASETFGETYQAQLAKVGVTLELQPRESAALADALRRRDFDSAALGLALPFASDPEQLWHSKWADGPSGNRSGLADARVDELIESIQRETDASARNRTFHALQRRIHELQPVMFGVWAPHRLVIARRLRGVQLFGLDPGYSIRRWYVDPSPR
jgi:peptide/nickel transport system substrate-binding protein